MLRTPIKVEIVRFASETQLREEERKSLASVGYRWKLKCDRQEEGGRKEEILRSIKEK